MLVFKNTHLNFPHTALMAVLCVFLTVAGNARADNADKSADKQQSEQHLEKLRNDINTLQSYLKEVQGSHQDLVKSLRGSDKDVAEVSKKVEALRRALQEERQRLKKLKAEQKVLSQDKQTQQKEIYWIELVREYKDPEVNSTEDVGRLPYKATFSDGTTKKGYLTGGYAKLNNIPGGEVSVIFGYPDAEAKLKEVRREIQIQLNDMLSDAAERAKVLNAELAKNSITMQSVILTGAFIDGMFGPIESFGDFCADVVREAQVRFDQWDAFAGIDDYEDLKDAVIERVGKTKKR